MAQIIAQRFPIAGKFGGHHLAIVDNGELITELHGLAIQISPEPNQK